MIFKFSDPLVVLVWQSRGGWALPGDIQVLREKTSGPPQGTCGERLPVKGIRYEQTIVHKGGLESPLQFVSNLRYCISRAF